MRLINLSSSCKNCYKCVRECPVKAISYINHETEIIKDRCIYCGDCFVVCPQNAGDIDKDLPNILEEIGKGTRVLALVDPYFAGFYPNKGQFITALRSMGFSDVYEVGLGAFHVIHKYEEYIETNQPEYAISAFCPSVNLLIKKYYKNLLKYIFPYLSPMLATGKYLKEGDPKCYTVFIGSCLSKKYERTATGDEILIDAVLTFDELELFFRKNKIDLSKLPDSRPTQMSTVTGRSYAVKNGISNSFRATLEKNNYNIFCVDGLESIRTLLDSIEKKDMDKSYLELYACRELCINGPCPPNKHNNIYKTKQNMRNYIKTGFEGYPQTVWDFTRVDVTTDYNPIDIHIKTPSEEEIQKALKTMDIESKKNELNCGACGYKSCREKAIAIAQGMSEGSTCIHYTRTSAEYLAQIIVSYTPNGIIILDDNFKIIEFNFASSKMFGKKLIEVKDKPLSDIIDDTLARKAYNSSESITNVKVYYEQYGLYTAQTITYINKYNLVVLFISDITKDENRKNELKEMKSNTVDITQIVIDKQMMIAQEIASLLGETTAETKVALNKLKNIVAKEGE